MIKVFTLNKNKKIELTKQELENLLNESFWDGYNQKNIWTYTSPSITTTTPWQTSPYWTISTTSNDSVTYASINDA